MKIIKRQIHRWKPMNTLTGNLNLQNQPYLFTYYRLIFALAREPVTQNAPLHQGGGGKE